MMFKKTLAKYYYQWHIDCLESAEYCRQNNMPKGAEVYERDAAAYAILIEENREAVEFFSQGDNAFLIESVLPEKFRGYE